MQFTCLIACYSIIKVGEKTFNKIPNVVKLSINSGIFLPPVFFRQKSFCGLGLT